MRKFLVNKKGFSLMELLLVVFVLIVMAGVVLSSLSPGQRLMASRDSKRMSDVENIAKAISSYIFDAGGDISGLGVDTTLRMLGTDTSGCEVPCGDFTGGSESTNLALGGIPSASANSSLVSRVNDGDGGTSWYVNGAPDGHWIQMDLGGIYTVSHAELRGSITVNRCEALTVHGSDDGSVFDLVYGPVSTTAAQEHAFDFAPVSYRYWRFRCDTAATNALYFYETRLFEAEREHTDSACLDLSSALASELLEIPMDPEDGSSAKTYYAVKQDGAFTEVHACNAETEVIDVSL